MSTPQRKVWSGWLSPGSEKNGSGSGNLNPNSSPRETSIAANGRMMDQDVFIDKISKLEKELYEYQYNMGHLLIEKKESISKNEQFEQELYETKELLKREQTSHIIAISEVEKREEKLRNALGVEKQCVLELEKALHDMRLENAEIKFTAESKLEEANALSSSVEEKLLQVEAKSRAADAKLAEVNRKTSEIQRKSVEFQSKERFILRERTSFNAEREAHERNLSHQREDLREWERKLQEGEDRLAEVRRLLNQKEERANENDRPFKQKQIELEEKQKRIDLALLALKTKEDDMSGRIENVTLKEKEAEATRNYLETKEKELLELEERLKVREQVEIQKLLDEHKIILDSKKHDFVLEMEQKKKSLDDTFKNKIVEVEKKKVEVNQLEAIITKREQALEKKLEKFKEKEKEFDSKSKALKEWEKSLKVEEKNIEFKKKEITSQKEDLHSLESELQKLKTDIEEQRLNIIKEQERLQVTEEERSEHTRLQLELKHEIEKNKHERVVLLKELDDLKQDRAKFEKEWEDLDEKRAEIERESEALIELKKSVEKWNRSETERLNNERSETRCYVESQLEALKLAKDSFAAKMEHEKSVLSEKYQSEKSETLREFETRKQELDTKLQNRETEIENQLREQEKSFEEKIEREQTKIEHLREIASREMEEIKSERLKLENEKQEILANRKHFKAQQLEMKKDVDQLVGLSVNLKDQREQFVKERDRFITFVEKQKGCKDCGPRISEFVFSDLESLDVNNTEKFTLPRIANDYLNERPNSETSLRNSGSPAMSWLRKCTSKIFIFSAGKKNELEAAQEKLVDVGEIPEYILSSEDEPEGSARVAIDVPARSGLDPSVNDLSQAHEIKEVSKQPNVSEGQSKPTRGRIRTRSRKTIVGDPSGDSKNKGSVHVNGVSEESRGESGLVGKGKFRDGRKRNRKETSEQVVEDSENSGSVATGGRRNTRRKGAPVVEEAPQQKRYNLRRPKIPAPVASNGALSNPSEKEEVEIKKGVPDSNGQPGPSTSFNHAEELLQSKVAEDIISPQQEEEDPGQVSIGRKLWTFIST